MLTARGDDGGRGLAEADHRRLLITLGAQL